MLPSIYTQYEQKPLTVGILGGGQLAKMMSWEIWKLGLRTAIIEHGSDSPAGMMTHLEFPHGWNNPEEVKAFYQSADIITLENEFIDPHILHSIAEHRPVFPLPQTIELIQDKWTQKSTFAKAGLPITKCAALNSIEDAYEFGKVYGYPYIMKTRTLGYDGYGNATIRNESDAKMAWMKFTDPEAPKEIMAEQFVHFTKELAVMVARNRRGETAVYPCVETIQENHICRYVLAPARVSEQVAQKAKDIALQCVEAIHGIGIFGIELFYINDEEILVNEIAPRPHNSGHYTIEACYTSQFENCIRAVLNLPLGSPELKVPAAVMVNMLGTKSGPGIPDSPVDTLKFPQTTVHLYGKKECRKGRKMGHLTTIADTLDLAAEQAYQAAKAWIW